MNCVCGHPQKDHVLGGRCRVPDCPCELFQPGDTLTHGFDPVAHAVRVLVALIGLLAALSGSVAAAERLEPPDSFARVADAARAASIVVREAGTSGGLVSALASPKSHRATPLADLSEATDKRQRLAPTAGVIVSPRGFALTSASAMLRLSTFEVFLLDGTPLPATLVGLDLRSDVAVLKLEGAVGPLPHLPLGDSGRIRVGDWLIAVGAPKGLEGTVTAGIVTATPVAGSLDLPAGLLQTDAATGRGSSGGALVSTDGEIVGLIVGFDADGMSYARPSNAVRKVYLELVERGHVRRAWLGIATQTLSPELARALGARDTAGILVADVSPDGPAAAAGLRSGDIVTAIDSTAIASRARLDRVVDDLAPGRTVRLSVRRAAVARVIRVTLGDEPDEWKLPPDLARARKLLGIEARALTPTMGVVASDVEPMSPAGQAGLEAGDVLREINGRLIRTLRDFQDAMRSVKTGTPVLMLVQRGDAAVYVALEPGP